MRLAVVLVLCGMLVGCWAATRGRTTERKRSMREEQLKQQQQAKQADKSKESSRQQKSGSKEDSTVAQEPVLTLKRYYDRIQDEYIYGHCLVRPNMAGSRNQQSITGTIDFRQSLYGGSTEIRLELDGFNTTDKVKQHGFHVHEFGDLSEGCQSAGSHYNPFDVVHGAPSDSPQYRHFGDLGNVAEDGLGRVSLYTEDLLVSLLGPFSVLGRAVVIHAGEDDLGRGDDEESLRTGNAGARLACCTIGLSDGSVWLPPAPEKETKGQKRVYTGDDLNSDRDISVSQH